jgi:hypothetical protein
MAAHSLLTKPGHAKSVAVAAEAVVVDADSVVVVAAAVAAADSAVVVVADAADSAEAAVVATAATAEIATGTKPDPLSTYLKDKNPRFGRGFCFLCRANSFHFSGCITIPFFIQLRTIESD